MPNRPKWRVVVAFNERQQLFSQAHWKGPSLMIELVIFQWLVRLVHIFMHQISVRNSIFSRVSILGHVVVCFWRILHIHHRHCQCWICDLPCYLEFWVCGPQCRLATLTGVLLGGSFQWICWRKDFCYGIDFGAIFILSFHGIYRTSSDAMLPNLIMLLHVIVSIKSAVICRKISTELPRPHLVLEEQHGLKKGQHLLKSKIKMLFGCTINHFSFILTRYICS